MQKTKLARVKKALVTYGEKLTAKQIAARYNISNPHDMVYRLRRSGYPIYMNEYSDTKGRKTQKYHFGKASRELIAAGYVAMAAGLA
jgi:hypothetical protein